MISLAVLACFPLYTSETKNLGNGRRRTKMKDIERRKKALISKIQQLQMEFDKLREPSYGQSRVYAGAGIGRHAHPDRYDSKLQ